MQSIFARMPRALCFIYTSAHNIELATHDQYKRTLNQQIVIMARTHIALVTPHNVHAVFVCDGEMGTRGRKLGPTYVPCTRSLTSKLTTIRIENNGITLLKEMSLSRKLQIAEFYGLLPFRHPSRMRMSTQKFAFPLASIQGLVCFDCMT